jgi:hypothetical protein
MSLGKLVKFDVGTLSESSVLGRNYLVAMT